MFSPPVGKRKRTTESSPDDRSTVNKTSTMAGNKEEDPNNLVSLLTDFEKDINQQVEESTDFDSINKAQMGINDNSKDIIMEQQRLATLVSFILVSFVHIKNLNDTTANLKIELNQSQFKKLITSVKDSFFYTNIDKIVFLICFMKRLHN